MSRFLEELNFCLEKAKLVEDKEDKSRNFWLLEQEERPDVQIRVDNDLEECKQCKLAGNHLIHT